MSRENLEVVRRLYEAFTQSDLDAASELFDPGIEFDISRTNPEGRVYHGIAGLTEAMEQWLSPWEEYRLEPLEFIDAGDDRVVVLHRERGRVKGTDSWTEHQRGVVYTVRGRRITRYEEHQGRVEALGAAGLEA
jgi:ketosteroid isomerase-like protein